MNENELLWSAMLLTAFDPQKQKALRGSGVFAEANFGEMLRLQRAGLTHENAKQIVGAR